MINPLRKSRPTKLAIAVWSIRKRYGMGQIKFAALIGISPSQISRYESSITKPDLKALLRLLERAEAQTERNPILQELKRQGIGGVLRSIQLADLLPQQSSTHTVCDGQPAEATPESPVSVEMVHEVNP